MQNEWLFSFGVCMLKHWMRRIERKSVLASLSDKQRAECINQTLHSPNMNYICTDTKREGKKTALMSLCESVFGYDLDCLESLTGLMVGAPKPQQWCSSSCLASLEHWHLSNHFQPGWYMKWNVWNVLQMAVWELESSSIIISSSTHYFFPFQTFIKPEQKHNNHFSCNLSHVILRTTFIFQQSIFTSQNSYTCILTLALVWFSCNKKKTSMERMLKSDSHFKCRIE